MIENEVKQIRNMEKVQNVLLSVFDKTNLDKLVAGLIEVNPQIQFFSTGGTFRKVKEILGSNWQKYLKSVSEYTGQPEMDGGLVKTLDYRIYLGLLNEPFNSSHNSDIERLDAASFDMVVVNLYPFAEASGKEGSTPENARSNIDIGGPCMLRATAKNYIRVLPLCFPADYMTILQELKENDGYTCLKTRYEQARKAFGHTAAYDAAISEYLIKTEYTVIKDTYSFNGEEG